MSSWGNSASAELPPIDEHLVVPESGYEMDEGKLVFVPSALEPRAVHCSKLVALLEAHAADDFKVAFRMLTRISHDSDRASDASVYPRARDPETGGRQLEHLAFELVSSESLGHAGRKAVGFTGRGVRRVFAIDIERERAFEWSRDLGTWAILEINSSLTDPALAVPLPVQALLLTSNVDDAVARALLAKRNPVLEAAMAERRRQSYAEGMAEAILEVLAARTLRLRPHEREEFLRERDLARLCRWRDQAASCTSAAELLAIF